MDKKKSKIIAVIVAHPDDETLWLFLKLSG